MNDVRAGGTGDPEHDALVRFVLARSGIRGVLVRLDDAWRDMLAHAHYPRAVSDCLGEACAAAALLTGHIKTQARLSVQLRGTAALRTLYAECTAEGGMRGIARFAPEPLPESFTPRDFGADAMLAITIEQAAHPGTEPARQQGLVGLDADSLAAAFEGYFAQSEQIPTRIALSADSECAVGLMLQRLPGGEADDADGWRRACALFDTLGAIELRQTQARVLLYRLFHEDEVRLLDTRALRFSCTCSRERVQAMLVSLGEDEAMAAAAATGVAEIVCEFCGRSYHFDRVDLGRMFAGGALDAPSGRH